MKYELRGLQTGDIVTDIMRNRGITDVKGLLSPSFTTFQHSKIRNIDKGIQMYVKHVNNSKILLIQDSDVDGLTSAAIVFQVSKILKTHCKMDVFIHSGKEHGLTEEVMAYAIKNKYNLIIAPDSGTNDIEQMKQLQQANIDILVLDHHEIEEDVQLDNVVIVNNQHQDCILNKNLSGVGVVYFFFLALIEKYNIPFNMEVFLDLVALGTVADSMDVTNLQVRGIVEKGFANIKNNFLREYYSDKKMYYKTISWGVASLLNAVIRVGTQKEKEKLFRIFCEQNNVEKVTKNKRKKNKSTGKFDIIIEKQSVYKDVLDIAKSVKTRQDKEVKALVVELLESYNGENIGIFVVPNKTKNINGLVANKLADKIQKPTLVLVENENCYLGSARGYEKYISNFRDWCLGTSLFNWCNGHSNAFGVSISKNNLELLRRKATKLKQQDIITLVDAIYYQKPIRTDVEKISALSSVWCKNCEEPIVAIENVVVDKKLIRYKNGNLSFFVNGTRFIKRYVTQEEANTLMKIGFNDSFIFSIIGNVDIVDIYGNLYVQVQILDYKIKDYFL